ncbi:hypothetical protein [Vibrio sp. D431a]|uniref:hypothetical protein n=1 Tax=Vibrio sp. D431a TaxID=2837388 RepID=UPI0025536207|nr:hypothetical protein [Vibrio sp. D431a]MDK9789759.1 hypothetical protein [Vibrio sp. D431a]
MSTKHLVTVYTDGTISKVSCMVEVHENNTHEIINFCAIGECALDNEPMVKGFDSYVTAMETLCLTSSEITLGNSEILNANAGITVEDVTTFHILSALSKRLEYDSEIYQ